MVEGGPGGGAGGALGTIDGGIAAGVPLPNRGGGAIPDGAIPDGAIPGGGPGGGPGCAASAEPQLRQNFIPCGFAMPQVPQATGNPGGGGGVCMEPSALPQLRQNDAPGGFSWPHIEHRINMSSCQGCGRRVPALKRPKPRHRNPGKTPLTEGLQGGVRLAKTAAR